MFVNWITLITLYVTDLQKMVNKCNLSVNQITLLVLYAFDSQKRTGSQESTVCELDYIGHAVCNQSTKKQFIRIICL